jgi:ABC-type molybdate transport system substrate-binding protein
VTRGLAAGALLCCLCAGAALAGCAPDAVPRTVTIRADSTLGSVLAVVVPLVEADYPGLTVRVDARARDADLVIMPQAGAPQAGARALVQASLVLVGAPGQDPAPTLESALSNASSVGVGAGSASERGARAMLAAAGLTAPLVRFPTVQAALDSVATRATPLAFALAPEALASSNYAVVYRPSDAEGRPVVLSGSVSQGAPPEAQALLDALAAPTAYRAWAAAGFRPPP